MKVLITSPGRLMRGTQILVRHHGSYSEYVVRIDVTYMFPLAHLLMTQRIYSTFKPPNSPVKLLKLIFFLQH